MVTQVIKEHDADDAEHDRILLQLNQGAQRIGSPDFKGAPIFDPE